MPLVNSTYHPPFWLKNGHLATIYPSSFRKVTGVLYERERIATPDNDFLDLDWIKNDSDQLVIISHGLEGSSDRPYVKGMAKYFSKKGWDILAWNCRSCSGEINQAARFYHHGDTDDLSLVIDHALKSKDYKKVVLIGFSMGGSLTVNYLGKYGINIPPSVKAGVAFSIPVDLKAGAIALSRKENSFYRKRFLKKLKMKMTLKAELYPKLIQLDDFDFIKAFPDFDERYTAPLHGFENADDFYKQASAGNYMEGTTVPILICSALNDPFLPAECYPYEQCKTHKLLHLETPKHGGHVGFSLANSDINYMELRAMEFVTKF
ncbi:MAG TPA: alpha/beta fold hydrolase [Fulvivirga sp.]|nr:alpha/beta fold hydrolase [Fulvivirga sp.]